MTVESARAEASLDELRTRVQGLALAPDDPRYDEARRAWNVLVDQRPAVIVQAENASDIVAAVRYARDHDLGIAVQATGHGVVLPADGGLLIVTSRMTGVRVDAASQTAWVEAGAQWGQVLHQAQSMGLAPLLGSSPGVGAVGYTLGGGMGWLARRYGLSADSVRSVELVTADARLLRASATENRDLFWGLRGGGGNFGVVTGMEIQLYPVVTVFGGTLIYPARRAREVLRQYRSWISGAPDELTSSIAIMNLPPIPQVPEFLRGQSVVMVHGCFCGPVEQGEELLGPWRDTLEAIDDSFRAMPFSDVGTISNDPVDPMPSFHTGAWLRDLDDEAIDTVIRFGVSVNGSSPLVKTEIRHAGGRISRTDGDTGAVGNRDASLIMDLVAMPHAPGAAEALARYAATFMDEMRPHLTGGVYLNFLDGREARTRARDGYAPDGYRRLMGLKAAYDPEDRFRFAFGIPPGA